MPERGGWVAGIPSLSGLIPQYCGIKEVLKYQNSKERYALTPREV